MNVVECDTADFLALFLDDEEAAIQRQMAAIGGDIDNAVHERRPQAIIRAGRDRTPDRADRYGSGGPCASSGRRQTNYCSGRGRLPSRFAPSKHLPRSPARARPHPTWKI